MTRPLAAALPGVRAWPPQAAGRPRRDGAYRVYLTGIRALRSGSIEANLLQLNEEFRYPGGTT